jgi:hypothetical protein
MGTHSIRLGAVVGVIAVAALALLPGAARATISPTYAVSGAEYSATSTEGRFAGTANGSTGDTGLWNADVIHQALSASCYSSPPGCAITAGGSIALVTSGGDIVSGSFTGGSITLVRQAQGCGQQVFHVDGHLATSAGSADFNVALTHYRVFLGSCVTVFATVGPDPADGIAGTLSF